jgi:hypothetical protein
VDLPSVHGHATGFVSPQNTPAAPRPIGLDNEMTVADCWFAALDQRLFASGNRCWTTRVVGVHLEGFHTWIQLEFAEHPGRSFLLHLTPWAGLHDAINIIRSEIVRGCVNLVG